MAILVVGAIGAYAGAAIGIGAAAGWMIGSYLYSSFLAPGQKQQVRTPELNDLRVMGTEYGEPIPYIIGTMSVAGQMWWNSDRRPIVTTTTTTQGGKGGGGSKTETTVTTYDMDALIGLCDNRIAGIWRIWDEGKLIWSQHPESPPESIEASDDVITWDRMTVYTGDPAQMPDPTYEAAFGVGNVPAYRHRAYVFFEGLHLGQSGRVPNLTFEVVTDGGDGGFGPWIDVGQLALYAGDARNGVSDGAYVYLPHHSQYTARITLPGLGVGDWTEYAGISDSLTTGDVAYGADDEGVIVTSAFYTSGGGWHDFIQWSHDQGVTWTKGHTFGLGDQIFERWWLAYGDGTFIAVCNYSTVKPFANIRTSADGQTWSALDNVNYYGWADLAFGGGWFVAVSNLAVPHQVMRSSDAGVSWEYITAPAGTWSRIVYSGDGHFVALMDGFDEAGGPRQNGAVMTSSDYGATWTPRNASHSRWWSALAANGTGIVVAVANSFNNQPLIDGSMASFDHGETWELLPVPLVSGGNSVRFPNITYGGNGYFYSLAHRIGTPEVSWGMVLPAKTTLTSETVTLEETVRRLLKRCGMVEGTQFDVSALASVTRPVRALFVSQVSPTRQTIDALASTYFFDLCVSDKLYFRPRGGAIAASIPYDDLGAVLDGSSGDEDPFLLKQSGDLEFPAQVSIVYRNVMNDYMVDSQMSDRLVSAVPDTAKVITLPLCMTPSEAKQVADVLLFNQAVNMVTVDSIKVLGDYVALEPSDAVSVFDAEGNSYRLRLTSRRDEYPLLEFSAVLDDVSVLTSSGITDENYDSSMVVEAVPLTLDLLLDIPMLRDTDDDAGVYVVAKGDTAAKWPGCVIYGSGDDVNYASQGAVAFPNIFGTCTTTLGNWTRGRLIDEANRVTVAIGPGNSLSSSTYDRVLNNKTVNACLIGEELLQFIDATAVSDGVYTLGRLLRGSIGTERAMASHGAGERFALLDEARMGRITMPNSYLGAPLYYKFITVGRKLDSDAAEAFTNTGVNLKPVSPVYLQVVRDPANNDATITWERRSRFTVRMIGAAGIDVPPDEVRWEIDVYADGTYASVVRTIAATVAAYPSAVYSAIDQAADGLTPGSPLFLKIYPISGTVGRGYPLTASA